MSLGNLPDGFSTSVGLDVFQTGDILFKQFTSAEDKLVFILYSDSYIYILLVILVMPKLIWWCWSERKEEGSIWKFAQYAFS